MTMLLGAVSELSALAEPMLSEADSPEVIRAALIYSLPERQFVR